jgi:glycine oxidase
VQPISTTNTPSTPDIAVIGGGIVGLWTAYFAATQGLSVVLIEKRTIGAGASGGMLGALMPHQTTNWDAKKQFQLEGLLSLETEISALEKATGMKTGYRRCGRLMPIRIEPKLRQGLQWAEASELNWPDTHHWRIANETPNEHWLPADQMPFGVNHDDLSARVDPRGLIAALRKAIETLQVYIIENTAFDKLDANGAIHLPDGTVLTPGRTVISAGWESFPLLSSLIMGETGRGVKGQAALLKPVETVDPASPILYDAGIYVIAHDNGLVAVGSTSENEFDDPTSTDERIDILVDRARALCPALNGAEIVERWAGVRPRAASREPLVGPIYGAPHVIVATGGFKISFGIAHLMAKAAVVQAMGETPEFLPDVFLPENRDF